MKPDQRPPRDWLLDRHASAGLELDALRRDVVASLEPSPAWREVLVQLVRPYRLAWRTLGVAWLVIALLHFSRGARNYSVQPPPPSPETVATWLNQLKTHETFAQVHRRH
ncbi:MAG: hypothetical protein V4773_11765 [Verrucomicrobiota bacterium]